MLRHVRNWISLTLLPLMLLGCATSNVDPNDTTRSVIFGYIDMSDAPTSLGYVRIKKYDDPDVGYNLTAHKGLFYHVGVKPGPYQVDTFYGSGFFAGDVAYDFGGKGRNATATIIRQPGVYFMGAHKYSKVKTGFFEQGKFDMKKTARPTEKELLTGLLALMRKNNKKYVRQIAMVERKLASMK